MKGRFKLQMQLIIIAILIFIIYSCEQNNYNDSNNELNVYYIDTVVTLKVTKCVKLRDTISDSTYTLCFTGPVNDYRCPLSDCEVCYGSAAIIKIAWIDQNQNSSTITLGIWGCVESFSCDDVDYFKKDTLGYRFCLIKLDPYPPDNYVSINQNDYIAKLKVVRL